MGPLARAIGMPLNATKLRLRLHPGADKRVYKTFKEIYAINVDERPAATLF